VFYVFKKTQIISNKRERRREHNPIPTFAPSNKLKSSPVLAFMISNIV
jgi:hypothetical protein